MSARDRLIVAIDEPTEAGATEMLARLDRAADRVKIGLTLFIAAGPSLVRRWVADGYRIFVDLKAHDIPYQVGRAVEGLADLGADLVTIHTAGGRQMMEGAARAVEGTDTRVLGVTVLTSMDAQGLQEVVPGATPGDLVLSRAALAAQSGIHGVVASPREAGKLSPMLPRDFEIVTPGVRPMGADLGDQRRVATPGEAIAAGATALVVGRPITGADEPAAAVEAILQEIEAAL